MTLTPKSIILFWGIPLNHRLRIIRIEQRVSLSTGKIVVHVKGDILKHALLCKTLDRTLSLSFDQWFPL